MEVVLEAAWGKLGRIRVTLLYGAALFVVAQVLFHLGPRVQYEVIREASTNLHNLGQGRLHTLIGSIFVNEAGPMYIWLPGLMAVLALGELLWHRRRLVVAFAVGHLGATLIVAVALAAAVATGLLSRSISDAADVGMSYGAVGVLGTFTAAIPVRWRPTWIGWWISVAVASIALSGGDFTNAGHAIALMLGMAAGRRFGEPRQWTPTRCALLAVATAFGYLLLGYNEMSLAMPAGFGAVGALLIWGATTLLRRGFSPTPA